MQRFDRRSLVMGATAIAAAIVSPPSSTAAGSPRDPGKATEPSPDPIAQLNTRFRELYGINREELFASTPLAAVMLIGTGEVWRVEYGQPVRSYSPVPWIVKVKGLMHAVIATQATAARLVRAKDVKAAREDAVRLSAAIASGIDLIAGELPTEVAPLARTVLLALKNLSDGWSAGQPATLAAFSAALKKVHPELEQVLAAVGEAVYQSVVAGLQKLAAESEPADWQNCLVGVCGVGFARRDNIEIAAAMEVLGRDSVGTRLLYFENAFTIPSAAAQIGAALADRALGEDVFGDPYRMWRDLLGDVAAKHAGGGFFPEMGRD